MSNPKVPTLPITLPYQDSLDLAYMLLSMYSNLITKLTPRNIDFLALALVFDVNSDDFKDLLVNSDAKFKSKNSAKTELSRLKEKGLIVPHEKYNRKVLHPHMEAFRNLIQGKTDEVGINFLFKRNGTK